jgi:hypothetical protein
MILEFNVTILSLDSLIIRKRNIEMRPQTKSDDEILSVARKVFFEKGTNASVQMIADEVGLSQPALFKRFGTKKELIRNALCDAPTPPWFKLVEKSPDDRQIKEQLKEIIIGIHTFFNTLHPIFKMMQSSGINPRELLQNGENKPLPEIGRDKLTKWLEECYVNDLIKKINFRITATQILGTIKFESFNHLISCKTPTCDTFTLEDDYVNELIEQILFGIGK